MSPRRDCVWGYRTVTLNRNHDRSTIFSVLATNHTLPNYIFSGVWGRDPRPGSSKSLASLDFNLTYFSNFSSSVHFQLEHRPKGLHDGRRSSSLMLPLGLRFNSGTPVMMWRKADGPNPPIRLMSVFIERRVTLNTFNEPGILRQKCMIS